MLDAPKLSKSEAEVALAIDFAGRAHTLENVRMSDALDLELDRSKLGESTPQPVSLSEVVQPTASAPVTKARPRVGGLGVYLYLVFFVAVGFGLHYLDAKTAPEVPTESSVKISENERLAMSAMAQGRYAAAIKFLEQATTTGKNINLLPSLALAYTQTSQIERARQVMRTYRSALHKGRTDD